MRLIWKAKEKIKIIIEGGESNHDRHYDNSTLSTIKISRGVS